VSTAETKKAIQDFATKVRAALGDLTPEEIQDLTDGLEADLAERAAEQGTDFGSAAGYANELRMAAGLAEPKAGERNIDGNRPTKAPRVSLYQRRINWWNAKLEQNSGLNKTWQWLLQFRGFLWVLRGYAVFLMAMNGFGVPNGLLPQSKLQFALAVFCVGCSLVLGMKFWAGNWFLRLIRLGGQVFTILAVIGTVFGAYPWQQNAYYAANFNTQPQIGLYENGREVTNIFAYNANGERLPLVQLFDQNGEPISVTMVNVTPNGLGYVNTLDKGGLQANLTTAAYVGHTPVWNAWPLLKTTDSPNSWTGKLPTNVIEDPLNNVPVLTVVHGSLLPVQAGSNASPSPTVSPSPSMSGK